MVHVIAESYVKKENHEEYFTYVKEMIECTVKEKGCVQYVITQGIENEECFVFVEKWETYDDLQNHLQSEHIKTIGPKMRVLRYEQKPVLKLIEKN